MPIVESMADLGLFGLPSRRNTAAWAATSRLCASRLRNLLAWTHPWRSPWKPGVSLGAMPIYRFGSEELKREWLPKLTSGKCSAPLA